MLLARQEVGRSSQQLHGRERSSHYGNLQRVQGEGQVRAPSRATFSPRSAFLMLKTLPRCRPGPTVLKSRRKSSGRSTRSFWRSTKSAATVKTSRRTSGSGRQERQHLVYLKFVLVCRPEGRVLTEAGLMLEVGFFVSTELLNFKNGCRVNCTRPSG